MRIEKLRELIKKENFRCIEIHDRINDDIVFAFMTKEDNITINITYNRDEEGIFGFSHANIVQGSFDFYGDYVESMLMCGQCSYIKHFRGHKLVYYYHKEK